MTTSYPPAKQKSTTAKCVQKDGQDGQVRLSQMPLAEICPSPENDLLYKPVDPADPEFKAMVKSVRRDGVREPLTITKDRFILSGHRRYAAAVKARLETVPCIIKPITRADCDPDAYLGHLREHNRQRIKSADEAFREEIVSADPREARRLVKEYREKKARVEAIEIDLGDEAKVRKKISPAKQPFLEAAKAALRGLRAFLPVTIRQIHYSLLNAPPLRHAGKPDSAYCNDVHSYKALSDLLIRARLEGLVSWDAISDPTRPVIEWNCYRNLAPFIADQLDRFLRGYNRNLQQSQSCHIEIVGEKNTVKGVIHPIASEYCIPYTLGRGYASGSPRRAMQQRFISSGKERLVLLILSDFDPEGEDIAKTFALSMRDEFDAKAITPIKVGLTHAQVTEMGLHPQMKAKKGSSRRNKFVDRFGENVWELEAVPPERLQRMLRDEIDGVMDVTAYNRELDKEADEFVSLETRRKFIAKVINDLPKG